MIKTEGRWEGLVIKTRVNNHHVHTRYPTFSRSIDTRNNGNNHNHYNRWWEVGWAGPVGGAGGRGLWAAPLLKSRGGGPVTWLCHQPQRRFSLRYRLLLQIQSDQQLICIINLCKWDSIQQLMAIYLNQRQRGWQSAAVVTGPQFNSFQVDFKLHWMVG